MQSLQTLSHQVRSFAGKFRGSAEDFFPADSAKQSASTPLYSAAQAKLAFLSSQLQALQQKIQQGEELDHRWQELQICLDLAEIVLVVSLKPEDVEPESWFGTLYKCFVQAADEAADDDDDEGAAAVSPTGMSLQVRRVVKMASELVYVHDRATLARVLIRALMLEHPHACVDACENVICAAANSDRVLLKRADYDVQSLSQLQQLLSRFVTALSEKQASVRPLFDDVTFHIRHAHWYEASMPKPAVLVVKVVGCGEIEVTGRYRPDVSKSEPCYRSKSGNEIVRRVRKCGQGNQIFVWHIRNPLTGSLFYGCISQRDTTIPPSAGWEVLTHGRAPAPSVHIESCNAQEDDNVSNLRPPVVEAKSVAMEFPLALVRHRAAHSSSESDFRSTARQPRRSQPVQLNEAATEFDMPVAPKAQATEQAADDVPTMAHLQDAAVAAKFQEKVLAVSCCGTSLSTEDQLHPAESFRNLLRRRIAASQKIVEQTKGEASAVVIAQALQRVPAAVQAKCEATADAHSQSLAANPAMSLDLLIEQARAKQQLQLQLQRQQAAERDGSEGGSAASYQSGSMPERKTSAESDVRNAQTLREALADETYQQDLASWKPSLSLPEFVGFTKSMLASQKNRAEVLGATLFPADDLERAAVQYVVQIALTEPAYRRERSNSYAEPKSSVAEYVASLVHIMEVQKSTKTRVFTLRRDLNAFTTLYTDIQAAVPDMDSKLLEFPDPFEIGETEENYIRVIKSTVKATISRKNQGSPYTYSSPAVKAQFYRSKNTPSLAAIHGQNVKPLQEGMQRLQQYLQGVLELLETVDPCQGGSGPQELAEKIGAALGRFLVGNTASALSADADTEASQHEQQHRFSTEDASRIRVSESSDVSDSVEACRPAWAPFSSGGMELFLQMQDTQGGKLSLRNEDQLLRAQNHRCFGCGERLVAGLFGLEKNFAPCRYFGRLFCRRWCHADDHRPIPHRILHSWDFQPHRVCRQAAQYLDSIAQNPIICVTFVNPRLFDDEPRMQAVRKYRAQLCSLVELVLDPPKEDAAAAESSGSSRKRQMSIRPEDDAFQSARNIIQRQLGERLHLGVDTEMYSLEDLAEVKSGELLRTVKALIATLLRILPPAHRPQGLGGQDDSPAEVRFEEDAKEGETAAET